MPDVIKGLEVEIVMLKVEIEMLEAKWSMIEDRVVRLERYASNDHNRITSLEDWQEEVTEQLDEES